MIFQPLVQLLLKHKIYKHKPLFLWSTLKSPNSHIWLLVHVVFYHSIKVLKTNFHQTFSNYFSFVDWSWLVYSATLFEKVCKIGVINVYTINGQSFWWIHFKNNDFYESISHTVLTKKEFMQLIVKLLICNDSLQKFHEQRT